MSAHIDIPFKMFLNRHCYICDALWMPFEDNIKLLPCKTYCVMFNFP